MFLVWKLSLIDLNEIKKITKLSDKFKIDYSRQEI